MIICEECGSVFNSEQELNDSRKYCVETTSGCPMAHAESVIKRVIKHEIPIRELMLQEAVTIGELSKEEYERMISSD